MPDNKSEEWEHYQYQRLRHAWVEQDLAYAGQREWTDYCINRHPLETPLPYTLNQAQTRYQSRLFYADNPVKVKTPIDKVQSTAQQSSNDFSITTGDEYLDGVLNGNVDGEGMGVYNWLVGDPLAAQARNGWTYLGVFLPDSEIENPTLADVKAGRVAPPKWFKLDAAQVINWIETEGDTEIIGQFSQILYKTIKTMPGKEGFQISKEVYVLWTTDEVKILDDEFKVIETKENPFGFVPIVRVDSDSLIAGGVQPSKMAVEASSLAFQSLRDQGFNVMVLKGGMTEDEFQLSSDEMIQIKEDADFDFKAPSNAPWDATKELLEKLQEELDSSVQQAHQNFARQGSQIGSGVAYQELLSIQGASVGFYMNHLIDKFRVTVVYAMRMLGIEGNLEIKRPENYVFVSETENLEQAERLDLLGRTAPSQFAKEQWNAKKNSKAFSGKLLDEMNAADKAAINNSVNTAPTPTDENGNFSSGSDDGL